MEEKKSGKNRIKELEERFRSIFKEMKSLEKEMYALIKEADDAAFIRAGERFRNLNGEAMELSPELWKEYQARAKAFEERLWEGLIEAIETGRPQSLEKIKEMMESDDY